MNREEVLKKKRVFIGDLQGCADELEDLLEKIEYCDSKHQLYFVGDLINRGPSSERTLRKVIELNAQSVLGNHDLHLMRVLDGSRTIKAMDTFQDILKAPDRDDLINWLRNRPLIVEWDDIVLVHAGLHPNWLNLTEIAKPIEHLIQQQQIPYKDVNLRFLTSVRFCDSKGNFPTKNQPPNHPFAPWDHFYRGNRIIVCGHWAARGLVKNKLLRSIDTGCVWGGGTDCVDCRRR